MLHPAASGPLLGEGLLLRVPSAGNIACRLGTNPATVVGDCCEYVRQEHHLLLAWKQLPGTAYKPLPLPLRRVLIPPSANDSMYIRRPFYNGLAGKLSQFRFLILPSFNTASSFPFPFFLPFPFSFRFRLFAGCWHSGCACFCAAHSFEASHPAPTLAKWATFAVPSQSGPCLCRALT